MDDEATWIVEQLTDGIPNGLLLSKAGHWVQQNGRTAWLDMDTAIAAVFDLDEDCHAIRITSAKDQKPLKGRNPAKTGASVKQQGRDVERYNRGLRLWIVGRLDTSGAEPIPMGLTETPAGWRWTEDREKWHRFDRKTGIAKAKQQSGWAHRIGQTVAEEMADYWDARNAHENPQETPH